MGSGEPARLRGQAGRRRWAFTPARLPPSPTHSHQQDAARPGVGQQVQQPHLAGAHGVRGADGAGRALWACYAELGMGSASPLREGCRALARDGGSLEGRGGQAGADFQEGTSELLSLLLHVCCPTLLLAAARRGATSRAATAPGSQSRRRRAPMQGAAAGSAPAPGTSSASGAAGARGAAEVRGVGRGAAVRAVGRAAEWAGAQQQSSSVFASRPCCSCHSG